MIADNKSSDDSTWDLKPLKEVIKELDAFPDVDLRDTGFELQELDELFPELMEQPEETFDVAEAMADESKPITKTGDIWTANGHRWMCGDSTRAEDVEKLMDGQKAGMVFTDPPYAVEYTGGSSNKAKRKDADWDGFSEPEYAQLIKDFLLASIKHVNDNAAYYIWFADSRMYSLLVACHEAGIKERYCVIWRKLNPHYGALGRQYKVQHEPCLYAHKNGASPMWYGSSTEGTIWELVQPRINELHPTQKPVGLAEKAIKNSSLESDIIIDLFLGSGTTLIACEKLGRQCVGMEIEPRYCDVICKRYFDFTSQIPVREADKFEFPCEDKGEC